MFKIFTTKKGVKKWHKNIEVQAIFTEQNDPYKEIMTGIKKERMTCAIL